VHIGVSGGFDQRIAAFAGGGDLGEIIQRHLSGARLLALSSISLAKEMTLSSFLTSWSSPKVSITVIPPHGGEFLFMINARRR